MGLLQKLFGRGKKESAPATPAQAAPPPKPTPEPEPEEAMLEIKETMIHELNDSLEKGQDVVVVDLRQPWEYAQGHIPGAISIPMMQFMERHEEIPKDKPVVVQCYHGFTSLDASGFLITQGWSAENVSSLNGGITGWIQTYGIDALEPGD